MRLLLNKQELAVYEKVKDGKSDGDWTVLTDPSDLNDDENYIVNQLQNLGIVKEVHYNNGDFLGWEINEEFPHEIVTDKS